MEFDGFEWDEFNALKSFEKHEVAFSETEQVFLNGPLVYPDVKHSFGEIRHLAFGETDSGRLLTVAFTLRRKKTGMFIRPISSRPMHKKERLLYEKVIKKDVERS